MNALARGLLLAAGVAAASSAPAGDLKIGYSGDIDGIKQAARIGYSSADGSGGGQLRLGLRYLPGPSRAWPDVQVEPLLALTVADERARSLDRKEVQAGVHVIKGMQGFLDAMLDAGVDRQTDASYDGLRVSGLLIGENIASALMAAKNHGFLFRPKAGLYVERMRRSADPLNAPNGRSSSAWVGIGVTWTPYTMPRHQAAYRNRFVRDFSASGDRVRGSHRFHAVSYTYYFYDPSVKPDGTAGMSLTIERAVGSDPVEGQRERHASTAVYLGFQL